MAISDFQLSQATIHVTTLNYGAPKIRNTWSIEQPCRLQMIVTALLQWCHCLHNLDHIKLNISFSFSFVAA